MTNVKLHAGKARVFVGSSSEGLQVGYALQNNLEQVADLTVWTQDVFRPSEPTLDSLIKQLRNSDYGVFVFSPDDVVRMRGAEHAAVRDNVIFEVGLFMGHLGCANTFMLAPRDNKPHLPSDLIGVTSLTYQSDRNDGNLEAALGPASSKLRAILERFRPTWARAPRELELPPLERRGLLTTRQREILAFIENGETRSHSDLQGHFSTMSSPELIYRLEQLRLLMFVSVNEPADSATYSVTYTLTPAYLESLRQAFKPFRSGTPMYPP